MWKAGGRETAVREELPERATHSVMDEWIGVDEVDAILEKTFYANSGARTRRNGVVRRLQSGKPQ